MNIYYSKIAQVGSGLTNQIFCLITSIIIANSKKQKIVIIDDLQNDYLLNTKSSIDSILNMTEMNFFLKKYNITIFDKNNINFKVTKVLYGNNNDFVDLTNIIISKFYDKNSLFIDKNTHFNNLIYDPCVGVLKYIYIHYKINNYEFIDCFDENLKEHIVFDLTKADFSLTFGWINSLSQVIFDDIISNIIFNDKYINISNDFIIKNNILSSKINIIHLRLEDDAIKHWAKMNNMTESYYKDFIECKYINIIKKYIDKNDKNIILTYKNNNNVTKFMIDNDYKVQFINKYSDGRELNAIVDFVISKNCNNIFIGNFNIEVLNGSTFSYLILKNLNKDIKKILIDLDRIKNDEYVFV
jgi:hypothetical protein